MTTKRAGEMYQLREYTENWNEKNEKKEKDDKLGMNKRMNSFMALSSWCSIGY